MNDYRLQHVSVDTKLCDLKLELEYLGLILNKNYGNFISTDYIGENTVCIVSSKAPTGVNVLEKIIETDVILVRRSLIQKLNSNLTIKEAIFDILYNDREYNFISCNITSSRSVNAKDVESEDTCVSKQLMYVVFFTLVIFMIFVLYMSYVYLDYKYKNLNMISKNL